MPNAKGATYAPLRQQEDDDEKLVKAKDFSASRMPFDRVSSEDDTFEVEDPNVKLEPLKSTDLKATTKESSEKKIKDDGSRSSAAPPSVQYKNPSSP